MTEPMTGTLPGLTSVTSAGPLLAPAVVTMCRALATKGSLNWTTKPVGMGVRPVTVRSSPVISTLPSTPALLPVLDNGCAKANWPLGDISRVVTVDPLGELVATRSIADGPEAAVGSAWKVISARLPPMVLVSPLEFDSAMPICPVEALTLDTNCQPLPEGVTDPGCTSVPPTVNALGLKSMANVAPVKPPDPGGLGSLMSIGTTTAAPAVTLRLVGMLRVGFSTVVVGTSRSSNCSSAGRKVRRGSDRRERAWPFGNLSKFRHLNANMLSPLFQSRNCSVAAITARWQLSTGMSGNNGLSAAKSLA